MLASVKWLEELLKTDLEIDMLKRVALNLGLEIEEEFRLAPGDIVIGRIKSILLHPGLKNLSILHVKTDKKIQIVTAAKNIKEGDCVLVVPAGKKLKDEVVAEKDFAGIKSAGVLVSQEELGLAAKSMGVIVLHKEEEGKKFKEHFDDLVVEIKTPANRPDLLSMIGIAREFAIGFGIKSTQKNIKPKQFNRAGKGKVIIKDIAGCPRYTARIFDGVNVKDSPFWMKWRLHCMGMKGINNIVDITNINMLLYGQPLHPFDLDLLKSPVTIRKAHRHEEFITLEGSLLKLDEGDLIIADKDGPIALAGVIGGRRAQITNSTRKVLLESAYFNPIRIAHTRRKLGIQTEASMRFERGADILMVDETSRITGEYFKAHTQAEEIEFIGVGKVAKPKTVKFSAEQLNKILSLYLTDVQFKKILIKTGIQVTVNKTLIAKIPSYRQDLQIEEDIYEEVARIYGYMNIPATSPRRWAINRTLDKTQKYREAIKNYLVGQGFNETYNLSLVSSKRLEDLGYKNFVRIKNPLNERFDGLRPTLFLGLLDCVNYNRSKGNYSLKLFEMGNISLHHEPFQEKRLGVIMGGVINPNFWDQKDTRLTYFDAKGIVEGLLHVLHIKDIEFKETKRAGLSQAIKIICAGTELGNLGCVEKSLCEDEYFYLELFLDKIEQFISEPFYMPPGKFPASIRDLSFLVDEGIEVPDVSNLITKVGGPVLDKLNLFDYYKGDNLPPGKKSLGFRLYFKAPDRTLTDREVDTFIEKIVNEVTERFKANLRTKEKTWTN